MTSTVVGIFFLLQCGMTIGLSCCFLFFFATKLAHPQSAHFSMTVKDRRLNDVPAVLTEAQD